MVITVLEILKILLLFLLILLLILLLLFVVVLIVPLRYEIKGALEDKNHCISGRVRWLGFFLRINFDWKEKMDFTIRILGIPLQIFGNTKKARTHDKKIKKHSKKKESEACENLAGVQAKNDLDVSSDVKDEIESVSCKEEEHKQEKINRDSKKNFCEKVMDIWHRFQLVCSKTDELKRNILSYYLIWEKEETKITFQRAKSRFLKMIKTVLPSRWKLSGEVGFDDPSLTGKMMGVLGASYPYVGKHIDIRPDFQEEKIRLSGNARGKIRIGTLLYHVIIIIINKHCIHFLKLIFQQGTGKMNNANREV